MRTPCDPYIYDTLTTCTATKSESLELLSWTVIMWICVPGFCWRRQQQQQSWVSGVLDYPCKNWRNPLVLPCSCFVFVCFFVFPLLWLVSPQPTAVNGLCVCKCWARENQEKWTLCGTDRVPLLQSNRYFWRGVMSVAYEVLCMQQSWSVFIRHPQQVYLAVLFALRNVCKGVELFAIVSLVTV